MINITYSAHLPVCTRGGRVSGASRISQRWSQGGQVYPPIGLPYYHLAAQQVIYEKIQPKSGHDPIPPKYTTVWRGYSVYQME